MHKVFFRIWLLFSLSILGLFAFSLLYDIIVNLPYTFGFEVPPLEVAFKNPQWTPSVSFPGSFIDTVLSIVALLFCWIIFLFVFARFRENKKLSTYLLSAAYFFATIDVAMLFLNNVLSFKVANNELVFPSLMEKFFGRAPFLALPAAFLFLLLFVLEMFRNGVQAEENKGKLTFFITINITTFSMLLFEFFNGTFYFISEGYMEYLAIGAVVLGAIGVFITAIIQVSSGLSLRRKTDDVTTKKALMYISIAGFFAMAMF
ncbi:MAG: hypothetical protein ACFFCS_26180, partial [Candidatus Hodarchaeota archaeon]